MGFSYVQAGRALVDDVMICGNFPEMVRYIVTVYCYGVLLCFPGRAGYGGVEGEKVFEGFMDDGGKISF